MKNHPKFKTQFSITRFYMNVISIYYIKTSIEFHCQLVLNFSSSPPPPTKQLNSRSKALSNSVTAVLMFKALSGH